MKHYKVDLAVFLTLALLVAGCSKKTTDEASLSGTGFDSVDKTEELAQLPQANTSNQQQDVEILPIETSPVTRGVPASTGLSTLEANAVGETSVSSSEVLSHSQQIQTALKSAGFYSGNIDGKIGPASRKAIQDFQQSNGLKVDGKVGPKTWSLLEKYLTTETSGN